MRTRTVCGVSSGDQPLVVSWLKDGQPLTPAMGVNVSALDSYSSLLSISRLDSRHSGEFTCVASNPAAEVRYTAKLQVKGNQIPACLPSWYLYNEHHQFTTTTTPLIIINTFRCLSTRVHRTPRSRYCCTLFIFYFVFYLHFHCFRFRFVDWCFYLRFSRMIVERSAPNSIFTCKGVLRTTLLAKV